jgi:uncharacterized protein
MAAKTDTFDLGALGLLAGEARSLEMAVDLPDLKFGSESYSPSPARPLVRLDVSRMVGNGWALRLRFPAELLGSCMRCLRDAALPVEVDAREVDRPHQGEELESPYVENEVLDVQAWARDAFALALPSQILCREGCRGLCPDCGLDLNDNPDHEHQRPPDPRWAALRDLDLG